MVGGRIVISGGGVCVGEGCVDIYYTNPVGGGGGASIGCVTK